MAVAATRINLAPPAVGRLGKFGNIIRRVSFAVLGVYVVVLAVAAGAYFFTLSKKAALEEVGRQLASDVEKLRKQEGQLALIQNRIAVAKKIAEDRSTAASLLSVVVSAAGSDASLSEVESGKAGLTFTVVTPSSQALANFLARLYEKQITVVELDSISGIGGGKYRLTLAVN